MKFYGLHALTLLTLSFSVSFSSARTWTDVQGRTLEAEYMSLEKEEVKVRRNSDGYVLFLPLDRLSTEDKAFVAEKNAEAAENSKAQAAPSRGLPADPFARPAPGFVVESRTPQPTAKPEVEKIPALSADRGAIPALYSDDLDKDYPSGPSCIMNFLIWWNESAAPGFLGSDDRKRAIGKSDSILEGYCRTQNGGNTIDDLIAGILRFSEKRLEDYQIQVVKSPRGPTLDDLRLACEDWNGCVLLFGLYEKSGNEFKRTGGRWASLVSIDGNRIVFNRHGRQLTGTVETLPVESVDRDQQRYFDAWRATSLLQYNEVARAGEGIVPDDHIAIIDSGVIFAPRRVIEP